MNKKIKVLDIYLDNLNPRHDPISDQQEIIDHLLKKEKVKNLAKDIAENGISPIELLAVVKDKNNKYIVVEGNRRICALTLLNDPDKAPDQSLKDYFKKLKEKSVYIPDFVQCEVFQKREDADLWIERRHEGEQSGTGTRQWNAEQKTRHNARLKKSDANALAQAIFDFALEYNLIENKEIGRVLTTASRYLGNPFFRKTLGIISSRTNRNVQITVVFSEFKKVISKFCTDLINSADPTYLEMTVSSRSNSKDVEQYAKQLIKDGFAPVTYIEPYFLSDAISSISGSESVNSPEDSGTKEGYNQGADETSHPQDEGASGVSTSGADSVVGTTLQEDDIQETHTTEDEASDTDDTQDEGDTGQPGTTRDPNTRMYLLSGLKGCIKDPILRRVYSELRNIRISENPLAVMLVARAFLEGIYISYYELKTRTKVPPRTKVHSILLEIIKVIEKDKESLSKEQKNAFVALTKLPHDKHKIFALGNLGVYAHAAEYPDNIKRIITEWDNISAIVQYMLVELYNAHK
ncbi:hypothetical protein ABBZ21_05730 [Acinetobacter baumannii]|uniref:hypothetical protein n=1 Tax=Acinetobacter baumannii TaxID=470 RepID=UPI00385F5729